MSVINFQSKNFRSDVRSLLRERLLDAAQGITVESGWTAVTMAKIADLAGVSRQTVYNEFGSKPELADELVMRELGRFLDVVSMRLLAHDDVVIGLESACEGALTLAQSNPLLKAVLDSVYNGESDLLPLLTTESQGLIDTATSSVTQIIGEHYGDIGLTDAQLQAATDAIVRLVLSHVMRPAVPPVEAAAQIAWIAGKVIG